MVGALLLVLLAGGMNGSFAVPMKYVRGWQWEHTWFIWSVLGMLIFPLAVAVSTIPALATVYRIAGLEVLAYTALFGVIWGAGTVLFGLGITRVGLALGFGIILGTSSSLGTIVPLVMLHPDQLFGPAGRLMIVGVVVVLSGVAACARAGLLRDKRGAEQFSHSSFKVGLGVCLLSGLASSFMSIGLNESTPISKAAESLGAAHAVSLNAVWPILLGGGFLVNALYCGFLIIRRNAIAQFLDCATVNVGLVITMALLWSGSDFVYSTGAHGMGPLGLVLGWPIFMAAIVLTANVWGLLTGEWRNAGRRAVTWAAGGCSLLILGIWTIALAGSGS